jgi:hypothetical protein
MTYLLPAYIFIGVCYATAGWIAISTDPSNKKLMDDFSKEPILLRSIAFLANALFGLVWPFSITVKLFVRFIRK